MILTPGQKITLTLDISSILTIAAGSGIATVVRLGNPPASDDPHGIEQFTGSRNYGPYVFLTVWTIGCVSETVEITGDFIGIGASGPTATSVTNFQMRAALKDQGKFQDVRDYISADEGDEASAQWFSGASVQFGDTLSNFIANRLSYNPTQMSDLFNLAATKG